MTLRALIFDVDGTLAETESAHLQAFSDTFMAAGLDWHWSVADYTRLLKTTGGKERMRAHRAALGHGPSDAQIAELHRIKTDRYTQIVAAGGLTLRPGVADLISLSRQMGRKLAVATTTTSANVDALCRACWGQPAAQIFDTVAAGDEVAAKKPAPDVYLLALARLNLPPQAALAFEDSAAGLTAARAAGLRVVVTPSLFTSTDSFTGADWLLPSLSPPDMTPDLRALLCPQPAKP